jgi:hypothetical protein
MVGDELQTFVNMAINLGVVYSLKARNLHLDWLSEYPLFKEYFTL